MTPANDAYGTDLRLVFQRGQVDLASEADAVQTVSGLDNLVQALSMRLLVDRGDLSDLGHPRYGSRIRDLLGQPNDRANRELIRRYVRKTLSEDPRVEEVIDVQVQVPAQGPDSVQVSAVVKAFDAAHVPIEVTIHAG